MLGIHRQDNAQPASGQTYLEADLVRLNSPPTASLGRGVSMRGAVLAAANRSTEGMRLLPDSAVLPRGTFSLRGALMHAFISYRVDTEGGTGSGNGVGGLLAESIRTLSMHKEGLQIPQPGWGIWPKAAKKPVPFIKEEAKVFLDRDCLHDGQSWLAGFVQGSPPPPHNLRPRPKPRSPKPCTLHPAQCTLSPDP